MRKFILRTLYNAFQCLRQGIVHHVSHQNCLTPQTIYRSLCLFSKFFSSWGLRVLFVEGKEATMTWWLTPNVISLRLILLEMYLSMLGFSLALLLVLQHHSPQYALLFGNIHHSPNHALLLTLLHHALLLGLLHHNLLHNLYHSLHNPNLQHSKLHHPLHPCLPVHPSLLLELT